jgi:hypothetical protein
MVYLPTGARATRSVATTESPALLMTVTLLLVWFTHQTRWMDPAVRTAYGWPPARIVVTRAFDVPSMTATPGPTTQNTWLSAAEYSMSSGSVPTVTVASEVSPEPSMMLTVPPE